jgi:hypothetical protein
MYSDASIELDGPDGVLEAVERTLAPFFCLTDSPASLPLGQLVLRCADAPAEIVASLAAATADRIEVDTSLYQHLRSSGRSSRTGSHHFSRIDATGTICEVCPRVTAPSALLYQSDSEKLVLDTGRFLKGAFTYGLETHGRGQFHSAAVATRDGAILVMGDMWQGKTTLVLEMLANLDCALLAWDTLVVGCGSGVHDFATCCGWPSPFSVSHGTLADQAALHRYFPDDRRDVRYQDLWREGKKSRLTAQDVAAAYAVDIVRQPVAINTVFFVRFAPTAATGLFRLEGAEDIRTHLARVYLGSRDPIYHNWHKFYEVGPPQIETILGCVAENLAETAQCFEMVWAPSAISIMSHVDSFVRSRKHVGTLLRPRSNGWTRESSIQSCRRL